MNDDGEMPEGWVRSLLTQVSELNPPKPPRDALAPGAPVTFVPMPAVDAEAGAITAPEVRAFATIRNGYTAFRDGDVIMAKITPCMENGKAAIARNLESGLGFGSTEFHVLRPTEAVSNAYIYYYIRQEVFRRDAEENMTGSVGQKRVPTAFLQAVELPLPPLAEQQRIVAKVEELLPQVNATRDRLRHTAALLKRFRQSVLAAACDGRLTADWRDVPSSNGDLPEGWREVTLNDQVAHLTSGSRDWARYYDEAGSGTFVMAQNIRPLSFDMSYRLAVAPPDGDRDRERSRVNEDDILITIVGANTGDVCRVPTPVEEHYVCQSVALVRLRERESARYIELYLNSPEHGQRQFQEWLYGAGRPLNKRRSSGASTRCSRWRTRSSRAWPPQRHARSG